MSFEGSIAVLNTAIEKLENLRRNALANLPVVRAAAFNILADVASGTRRVLELARTIEVASGQVGTGVRKVCGNWILSKEGDRVVLMKLKPFRAVMYDAKGSEVAIANDEVKISISASSIRIKFRGRDITIDPLSIESINSKVQEIKSIGRYMLLLIDELTTTLNVCRKSLPLTT